MYKLDHARDFTEYQAIQRRRRLDQERMQRIFDPKVRVMGIDVQGLQEQIRIKNELQTIEDERNQTSDYVAMETNKLLQMLDAKVSMARREMNEDVNSFRKDCQKTHERRDFDLYDPERLKKDRPAREGDADSRNTVSGIQKFEGEDLEREERLRLQKQQMEMWTWEKMRENEAKLKAEAEYDARREQEVVNNNTKILHLVELERQHKRGMAKSDMEFNRRLAMEKRMRENHHKQLETQKNQDEIELMRNGDLLMERPAPPQPFPHTLRIDAFKGMSEAQIAEIRATREKQVQEAKERADREKKDEKSWAKHHFWASRATLLMERERQRQEREKQMNMLENNRKLAAEFKGRKNFIDRTLYTNPPTEAYFSQFNTTSR